MQPPRSHIAMLTVYKLHKQHSAPPTCRKLSIRLCRFKAPDASAAKTNAGARTPVCNTACYRFGTNARAGVPKSRPDRSMRASQTTFCPLPTFPTLPAPSFTGPSFPGFCGAPAAFSSDRPFSAAIRKEIEPTLPAGHRMVGTEKPKKQRQPRKAASVSYTLSCAQSVSVSTFLNSATSSTGECITYV